MFQKFVMTKWQKHKLVHHIMPVLKFGEMSLMTVNVIYGLLGVFCMKCAV